MRLSLLALLACAWSVHAQPGRSYLIDTFAGTVPDDEGVPANSALLNLSALTLAFGWKYLCCRHNQRNSKDRD
jgi:hypothetical protein